MLAELGSWRYASTLPAQATDAGGLLNHMGFDPVDIDSLCARAGLPAETITAELLRLELDGLVATLPGGRYQRLT